MVVGKDVSEDGLTSESDIEPERERERWTEDMVGVASLASKTV